MAVVPAVARGATAMAPRGAGTGLAVRPVDRRVGDLSALCSRNRPENGWLR